MNKKYDYESSYPNKGIIYMDSDGIIKSNESVEELKSKLNKKYGNIGGKNKWK